ncbi:MAG: zinc ribbon domain-containing protein [Paludibacteraceae bacterium]|nr:zinc ribbon domain-containing protein [Paludibacteraceae bacterium]
MYPEEIETLIKSIVADGKYTVGEQRVLHAKAKQFDIDGDELDVYVLGLVDMVKTQSGEQIQSLMNGKMYPEEIETLIKSIIANGMYTYGKQRFLHAKAKQFGIDCDEIDVYVLGLVHMLNEQSGEQIQSLMKGKMYPEEIETLIKSIIADGMYTDGEQRVLHAKAKQFGIDCDEIDVYVQGLVHMLNEQEQAKVAQAETKVEEQRQSLIMGNVRKCPNCGVIVSADLDKCPECGCNLTNVAVLTAKQRLFNAIENVPDSKSGIESETRTAFIIKMFPAPSTKEELLELISAMDLRRKSEEDETLKKAFNEKYRECILTAKVKFPNDDEFNSLLALTEKAEPLNVGNKVMDTVKEILSMVKPIAIIFAISTAFKYLFS